MDDMQLSQINTSILTRDADVLMRLSCVMVWYGHLNQVDEAQVLLHCSSKHVYQPCHHSYQHPPSLTPLRMKHFIGLDCGFSATYHEMGHLYERMTTEGKFVPQLLYQPIVYFNSLHSLQLNINDKYHTAFAPFVPNHFFICAW